MAKLQLLLILASAAAASLCFALSAAAASPDFTVEGRVYCDTCRAGFETTLTKYLEGAKVKLECKNYGTGKLNMSTEGVTDASGTYRMDVVGKHEENICEVVLVKSPEATCAEVLEGRDRARVVLSKDTGIASPARFANPLGFLGETPLPGCGVLLQKYALNADED